MMVFARGRGNMSRLPITEFRDMALNGLFRADATRSRPPHWLYLQMPYHPEQWKQITIVTPNDVLSVHPLAMKAIINLTELNLNTIQLHIHKRKAKQ